MSSSFSPPTPIPVETTLENKERLAKLQWPALRRLLVLAAPHRNVLVLAGLCMVFSTAISLSLPLIAREVINHVTTSHSVADLDRFGLGMAALVFLSTGFGFTEFYLAAKAGNRIVMDLRLRLFRHMQDLPVSFFDRTRSGDLTSLLSNDVSLLQSTLTDDIVKLFGNVLTLVGGIVLLVFIDGRLTILVVGLLVLTMVFFVVFGRALRKIMREGLDALAQAMGGMTEAISNVRLIKAFGRAQHEVSRAEQQLERIYNINVRAASWEGIMGAVAAGGSILVLLGVVWYGGRSVMNGSLRLGDLLAFLWTIAVISGPMASIASLYTRLQRAVAAGDRIFAVLDQNPEPQDSSEAGPFPAGPGELMFRDVHFGYVPEVPVLTGLTLTLPAGKVTAIVGASGAGKSTLASLLFRFYEVTVGSIEIDGVALTAIRRGELREHAGIVPQDPILFTGTIRENIRYGRLTATDTEVESAAKDANVEEFALGFPDGYETMIGERGVTLSGGQKQRVAIARALLKDPRILVLDEATSALDTQSESLVREALDRLMKGRTTMVIAHRLSTIQNADQIAVLRHGLVVELGTHKELLASAGFYSELHSLVDA